MVGDTGEQHGLVHGHGAEAGGDRGQNSIISFQDMTHEYNSYQAVVLMGSVTPHPTAMLVGTNYLWGAQPCWILTTMLAFGVLSRSNLE